MIHQSIFSPIGVSGSREVETGFEARKRRQTWKHDQLAKGTARLGKFQHLAAAGPNSPGDIAASVATLGSRTSHEGLILDKNQQQMGPNLVKLPNR